METCLSADATFRDVIQAILQDVAPHVRHVRLCSRVLFELPPLDRLLADAYVVLEYSYQVGPFPRSVECA